MLTAGTSLLHYRIAEKVGEGGMGAVWRATDATLDRDVAIKVFSTRRGLVTRGYGDATEPTRVVGTAKFVRS